MEKRLAAVGIVTMARLLDLDEREARLAWGSVWGERMYWLLRGAELPEVPTHSRSIGHSHVLAPDKRPPDRARLVARRLVAKAATRLRRAEKRTGMIDLFVRGEAVAGAKGPKWSGHSRLPAVMDTLSLLEALRTAVGPDARRISASRYLQVGVTLSELGAADALQPGLFDSGAIDAQVEAAPAGAGPRHGQGQPAFRPRCRHAWARQRAGRRDHRGRRMRLYPYPRDWPNFTNDQPLLWSSLSLWRSRSRMPEHAEHVQRAAQRRTTGKSTRCHPGKAIEPRCRARGRFGHQRPRKRRQDRPLPRIAMRP